MRYIDEEIIYRETDGGKDIFRYYFPNYEYGNSKAKLKLRSDEKTASSMITLYRGSWRVTDFGNQQEVNSLNAISFVMWYNNFNYYESLIFVEEVILRKTIDSSAWKKPEWRAEYECRDMGPDDVKGQYNFVYKEPHEITQSDLYAIGRYITTEILENYNCRVLKHYEYCSYSEKKKRDVVHKYIATVDYPIFVFDYGKFQKIYKPHEQEKRYRFSYAGEKEKDYIYGFRQLLKNANEFAGNDDETEVKLPRDKPKAIVRDIFRCSGESDALNLASLGFHVYWLNSETAELAYDDYKRVDDLCENHYQIMDLDTTGREMALKNSLKYIDLFTIELPEWLGAKRDFRGNPCKDLKDFVNLIGNDWDDTRMQFIYRKAKARKVKFWQRTDKGYDINMEFFYFFLKANGFYQMEYTHMKNTDYCYAWVQGKVVDLIPPDGIKRIVKRFTKDWIKRKNITDEIAILNKLNTSAQISEANIDTMDDIKINFKNVTAQYEYIHFKNGSLRVSRESIERIKHDEVPNHILGAITIKNEVISHLVDKDIPKPIDLPAIEIDATPEYQAALDKLANSHTDQERQLVTSEIALIPEVNRYSVKVNDKSFIFTNFMRDITRIYWRKEIENREELTDLEHKEEMLALANTMYCLGYMCSQYKNQGKPWIVFIQDMKISQVGQSSGRSGKSLVTKALKFVRQHFYIEGRKLDDKNMFQFIYDGLTEFHDIIEVDDLAEFGDFTFFYTQTTGNRTVNSKHTSPFVLEYEDSGKMIISSNFELPNTDSSTMARLLNCGVSDYYHEQTKFNDYNESRSPLSKFGRELYTDFTDDEWVKFYNFIAYCIQLYMRFDKIQPPMANIEKRQLRREMSEGLGREENFLKWASDYFQVWNSGEGTRPGVTPENTDCAYLDTLFDRQTALIHFFENSGISENRRKSYNSQRFKTHIEAWAQYNDFVLNPADICNDKDRKRIIRKVDGKSKEYFYIATSPAAAVEDQVIEQTENLPF